MAGERESVRLRAVRTPCGVELRSEHQTMAGNSAVGAENTRTCLHTPGEELLPSDVEPAWLTSALADAAVVYSDGRMTEVAILLARAAQGQGKWVVA